MREDDGPAARKNSAEHFELIQRPIAAGNRAVFDGYLISFHKIDGIRKNGSCLFCLFDSMTKPTQQHMAGWLARYLVLQRTQIRVLGVVEQSCLYV